MTVTYPVRDVRMDVVAEIKTSELSAYRWLYQLQHFLLDVIGNPNSVRLNEDDKEECYLTQVRMLKEQKQILRGKCCQERKVCFISEAGSWRSGRLMSKSQLPMLCRGQELLKWSFSGLYRQRKGAMYRMVQSALIVILKLFWSA